VDGGAGFDFARIDFGGDTPIDIDLSAGQAVTFVETGVSVRNVEAFEIRGGLGADRIVLTANNDVAFGNLGNDTLQGNNGDDLLSGCYDGDVLEGGDGAGSLEGGEGQDILTGGAGADVFQFGEAVFESVNVDLITDFEVTNDYFVF